MKLETATPHSVSLPHLSFLAAPPLRTLCTSSLLSSLFSPLSSLHGVGLLKRHTVPYHHHSIMRRGIIIFIVVNLLVVAFLVHSVFTLLTLLFEDGSKDVIHRAEIPAPNSPLIENRPQLIPKIIHQTYINNTIPSKWSEARQSCLDLHQDYEYKVREDNTPGRPTLLSVMSSLT